MREFEVKYKAEGIIVVNANDSQAISEIFYDENMTTNREIIEGIVAGLEIYGNEAMEITAITEVTPTRYFELWRNEVLDGVTLLGYSDWVILYKKEEE